MAIIIAGTVFFLFGGNPTTLLTERFLCAVQNMFILSQYLLLITNIFVVKSC